MKTRGKWLLVTAAAFVLFSSVTARAGEHYCWATGALGGRGHLQDIAIGHRKMHDYQFFRAVQRWLPPLHADCGTL
jgi:hypothetical protein